MISGHGLRLSPDALAKVARDGLAFQFVGQIKAGLGGGLDHGAHQQIQVGDDLFLQVPLPF